MIFQAMFFLKVWFILPPNEDWMFYRDMDNILHFVLAIKVLVLFPLLTKIEFYPKLSISFNSMFFYFIVTIPYLMM